MTEQASMNFRERAEAIDREERAARREAQRAYRAARAAPPARGVSWSTKPPARPRSGGPDLEQHEQIWAERNPAATAEEHELRKMLASREEAWSHKAHGTAATHAHNARPRVGAVARLYASNTLDDNQLAYADMIKCAVDRVRDSVSVRTASLETRVDVSRRGGEFFEALGSVRMEQAFTNWRASLPKPALVIDIVVEDLGLAAAARRHRVHHKRASQLLVEALKAWPRFSADARRRIDEADLARAHARLN